MSDETAVQQDATPAPQDAQPTGAEPGQKTEAAKTFTQAELDAIVKERLQREEKRRDEAVKKAAAEAEARHLAEQGKYEELFKKAQSELEQERQRAKSLEIAGIRRDVAARLNLPNGLVDRLRGDTEDEITADAQTLLAALPKPAAPNINAGDAGGSRKPSVLDGMDLDNLAARLGISAKYAKEYLNNGGS